MAVLAACVGPADDESVVASAALPGYLDDFKADDGLLMVPQLRHEAAGDPHAGFAGDVRATYLYVMIETLTGHPFVDEQIAATVSAYPSSEEPVVTQWEDALKARTEERLRGRIDIAQHGELSWVPELGGDGGRYLPDLALVLLDLGLEPVGFAVLDEGAGAGSQAHAAVARWVLNAELPDAETSDLAGWRSIVKRGPADNYREYLLAATALVLASDDQERAEVVASVSERLDEDRYVDDVPWLVPTAEGTMAGDLLASLAGVYFDLAARGVDVVDVLERRESYSTSTGAGL